MQRMTPTLTVAILSLLLVAGEAWSRGGRGGGGARASGGAGAGGARATAASRTPSMSRATSRPSAARPAASNRPTTGGPSVSQPSSRPSVSGARPNTGANRPAVGDNRRGSGDNRPQAGGSRPNTGDRSPSVGGNRLGAGGNRAGSGGNRLDAEGGSQIAARPGASGQPSRGDLQDFLDLPGSSGQRPGNRPNLPSGGDRTNIADRKNVVNRPNAGDRNDTGDRTSIGDSTSVGNRTNIGDRTNVGGDRTRIGDVNINTGNNLAVNRQNNINSIRSRWTNADNRPFDRNWWNGHQHLQNDPSWRWHNTWSRYPANWCWRPCTWAACGAWFTWTVAQPYSYNYGTNVVYRDNYIYINDKQYASTEVYYQQAESIAQAVPAEVQPDQVEWMPLGVFAIAEETATDSGMMVQLAVSKEGIIAGTFYNDITGSSRPIEGMVDQKTQRAAWKFADGTNPEIVMETGIYNLTQDEATALLHFGPDQLQTWLMVRLPAPEGDG